MERLSSSVMLVARILLSSIFLFSGVKKIFAFSATQAYMAQYGMKMTGLFLVLAILFEVGGGVSLPPGSRQAKSLINVLILLKSLRTSLCFPTSSSDGLRTRPLPPRGRRKDHP